TGRRLPYGNLPARHKRCKPNARKLSRPTITVPDMTSVAGAKRPGPRTGLSVAVLVVGAVHAVFGLVKAVAPFVDTLTSSSFATPGVSHMNLSKGTYLVYQAPGGSAITTDDVTITADSGGFVNTRAPRYRQELTR